MNIIIESVFNKAIKSMNLIQSDNKKLKNIELNVPQKYSDYSEDFLNQISSYFQVPKETHFLVYQDVIEDEKIAKYIEDLIYNSTVYSDISKENVVKVEQDILDFILDGDEPFDILAKKDSDSVIWDKNLGFNIESLDSLIQHINEVEEEYASPELEFDNAMANMKKELDINIRLFKLIKNQLNKLYEDEMSFSSIRLADVPKNITDRVFTYLLEEGYIKHYIKVYCKAESCYSYSSKEISLMDFYKLRYLLNYCNQFDSYKDIIWEKDNENYKDFLYEIYSSKFGKGCLDCGNVLDFVDLITYYKEYQGYLFSIDYYKLNF